MSDDVVHLLTKRKHKPSSLASALQQFSRNRTTNVHRPAESGLKSEFEPTSSESFHFDRLVDVDPHEGLDDVTISDDPLEQACHDDHDEPINSDFYYVVSNANLVEVCMLEDRSDQIHTAPQGSPYFERRRRQIRDLRDNRVFPRAITDQEILIYDTRRHMRILAQLGDLSKGGAFVISTERPPRDTTLTCAFYLDEASKTRAICCSAKVVWHAQTDDLHDTSGFGLRFLDINAKMQAMIGEFVSEQLGCENTINGWSASQTIPNWPKFRSLL